MCDKTVRLPPVDNTARDVCFLSIASYSSSSNDVIFFKLRNIVKTHKSQHTSSHLSGSSGHRARRRRMTMMTTTMMQANKIQTPAAIATSIILQNIVTHKH